MSVAISLEKGLQLAYSNAYSSMLRSAEYALIKQVAQVTTSTNDQEKYGWLGDVPTVREWLGDRHAGSLAEYDYTIKNKNWEVAIGIDRNDIEDDNYGQIIDRVKDMPLSILTHKWALIEALLVDGTTGLSYDGSAFFSNRTSPNDNLLAGTGSTTIALLRADIASAYAAMYSFTSDTGRKLRLKMDTIVCAVEMYALFLEAITSVVGESSKNTASLFIKNVIPIPGLSDTTDWYGLSTNRGLKSLILQERRAVEPTIDDSSVKQNRKYIFGTDARYNAGYGFHQMAVKVVNT